MTQCVIDWVYVCITLHAGSIQVILLLEGSGRNRSSLETQPSWLLRCQTHRSSWVHWTVSPATTRRHQLWLLTDDNKTTTSTVTVSHMTTRQQHQLWLSHITTRQQHSVTTINTQCNVNCNCLTHDNQTTTLSVRPTVSVSHMMIMLTK